MLATIITAWPALAGANAMAVESPPGACVAQTRRGFTCHAPPSIPSTLRSSRDDSFPGFNHNLKPRATPIVAPNPRCKRERSIPSRAHTSNLSALENLEGLDNITELYTSVDTGGASFLETIPEDQSLVISTNPALPQCEVCALLDGLTSLSGEVIFADNLRDTVHTAAHGSGRSQLS